MGLGHWGLSFRLVLPCSFLCTPIHSIPYTFGTYVATGYCNSPPAQLSMTVPAKCQVCLPGSQDHKFTFPEGDQIGPAGQVLPVDPDTQSQETRSGEGQRGKSQLFPGWTPSEGLAGRGRTKGQLQWEPSLWMCII